MTNRRIISVLIFIVTRSSVPAQWQHTSLPTDKPTTCLAAINTTIFAGVSGEGVYISTDGGTNWTAANNGLTNHNVETYGRNVESFGVSGTDLFTGLTGGQGVFRSTDNGASWTDFSAGLPVCAVYSLVSSGGNVFAGTYSRGAFRSPKSSPNWTLVNSGMVDTVVYALAVIGAYVFAGTSGGGVYRTWNSGASWAPVNNGLMNNYGTYVHALATSDNYLFAGTPSGVFRSTDSGDTWVPANNGFPNVFVYAFAIEGSYLFAGTWGEGVLCSTNNGGSWVAVNTGMLHYQNSGTLTLAISGTTLFAGGFDGVWRRPLAEMVTGFVEGPTEFPWHFELAQNYPNPFNPSTTIRYGLPAKSYVSLTVFNTLGQQVATLQDGDQQAGFHEVRFDGSKLASGVYLYRIQAGDFNQTRKLLLIR